MQVLEDGRWSGVLDDALDICMHSSDPPKPSNGRYSTEVQKKSSRLCSSAVMLATAWHVKEISGDCYWLHAHIFIFDNKKCCIISKQKKIRFKIIEFLPGSVYSKLT
jgi:hypothetical protein